MPKTWTAVQQTVVHTESIAEHNSSKQHIGPLQNKANPAATQKQ
jgi:hypothetical protein